jgi:hypothetical protein
VTRFGGSADSGASSSALSSFGLKFELDIGEDGLNRLFECGAVVSLFFGQVAPDNQGFEFALVEVTVAVRPAVWGNCSFFDGWRDQL